MPMLKPCGLLTRRTTRIMRRVMPASSAVSSSSSSV
jgi:hypothetical protein